MGMDQKKEKKKGVTGEFFISPRGRISFPHLVKPNDGGEFPDGKYKATLLMPKASTDTAVLKAKMIEVAKKAWPGKPLKDIKWAIQDGDKKFTKTGEPLAGYPGNWFITCKSVRRPGCIDSLKNNIDAVEVYAGCWARFSVTPGSYESTETVKQPDGSRVTETLYGVTLYLNNVQKLEEGEALVGNRDPRADFPDDTGSDDPKNYTAPSTPATSAASAPAPAPSAPVAPAPTPATQVDDGSDLPF